MVHRLLLCLFFSSILFAELVPIDEVFEPQGSFDPKLFGKVAVLQWVQTTPAPLGITPAQAEVVKQKNRSILARYIREAAAKGARMVITPEFGVVGYPYHPELPPEEDNFQSREEVRPYLESVPGPSSQYFAALSKELGIILHIGVVEIDRQNRYYNTVVALDPNGEIVARYRKIHLYQVEHKFLSEGEAIVAYESPFGKVGIVICSDIYSSFPMDEYQGKVKVLALSTSWAQWNTGMAAFQRGARWVNGTVLAANQTYFPDSGVINPDGTKQSHIRQSTGLAYGYLRYARK